MKYDQNLSFFICIFKEFAVFHIIVIKNNVKFTSDMSSEISHITSGTDLFSPTLLSQLPLYQKLNIPASLEGSELSHLPEV